jgi:hypothetical protein
MSFSPKYSFVKLQLLFAYLFVIGILCSAQTIGDFRSFSNGSWAASTSWETYDGASWEAATTFPGENAGTYAVEILAGHTISTTGISTEPMGTLTISGTLRLNGSNSMVNFFFNTALIYITPDLTPPATIYFDNKSNLVLPQDAVLRVWLGGLSGDCNNNQKIQIGTLSYAACNGAPGSMFTFAELMAAGGTLNAVGMIPPLVCQGSTVQLEGGYTGAIGTPVTYNWTSSGPAVLVFSPSNTAKDPTITPTVPGVYSITLTVSTNKGTQIYSNTESTAMIVAPTSSVTNAAICEGDSYPFNGTSYNTEGTYSTLLSSVTTGCDSTAILNLSVIAVSSVINDTICEGDTYYFNGQPYTEEKDTVIFLGGGAGACNNVRLQLKLKKASEPVIYNESICIGNSYEFYGNTYFTGGTYIAHLVNAVGCDSTVVLNLTVLAPSSYELKEVCSNNLPHVWNNKEYYFEGIYKDTIPNVNSLGCDSIATLELVIEQVTYSTTTVSVCESDLPFSWNLKNYTQTGVFKDTLVNSVGCDSIVTLNLTVLAASSVEDITICETQLPYSWNGLTFTEAGTQTVTLQNIAGCDSTLILNLTVHLSTSSITRDSICLDEGYFFNGVNYTTAGTYSDTLINAVGCDSIAILELFVNLPTSSMKLDSICSTALPYSWNGLDYTISGTFTKSFLNSVGCDSIATLKLKVKQVTYSTTTVSVCESDLPYDWNLKSYTESGVFKDTLANSVGCDSVATLNLTVNPLPTVTNTPLTQTICSGESTVLVTLTSVVTSTTFEWTASTDSGITGFTTSGTNTIPAQTLINPDNSTAGTVRYVITPIANGCTGTAVNYVVTVNPGPLTSDIYHQ